MAAIASRIDDERLWARRFHPSRSNLQAVKAHAFGRAEGGTRRRQPKKTLTRQAAPKPLDERSRMSRIASAFEAIRSGTA
jgi:hypothetical protein